MDVDNPANRLQITSAGYYSFDVTGIVKAWIADGVQNILKVDSLLANGTTGSFDFASKEKITGQHILQHNAQLLITLVGAGGITLRAQNVATVSENQPTTVFSPDSSLSMNNAPGSRAYTLLTAVPSQQYVVQSKQAIKTSMVAYVNAPIKDQITANPVMTIHTAAGFDAGSVTWNSLPVINTTAIAQMAVSNDPTVANQVVIGDYSQAYVSMFADTVNNGNSGILPSYQVALQTNLGAPITMDGESPFTAGHVPRTIGVYANNPPAALGLGFDTNDNSAKPIICMTNRSNTTNELDYGSYAADGSFSRWTQSLARQNRATIRIFRAVWDGSRDGGEVFFTIASHGCATVDQCYRSHQWQRL